MPFVSSFSLSLMPGMERVLRSLRAHLPPLNFITLHYIYYISVCLLSAIVFWGSSTRPRSVTFTDSLFLTVSAMTQAGLNTVNLSQLNTFQQFILFFLILIGSSVLISSVVVHIRKKAFERRFASIIERQRKLRKASKEGISRPLRPSMSSMRAEVSGNDQPEVDGVVIRGRAIKRRGTDRTIGGSEDNPGNYPPAGKAHSYRSCASGVAVSDGSPIGEPYSNEMAAGQLHVDTRAKAEAELEPEEKVELSNSYDNAHGTPNENSQHIRFAEALPLSPRQPISVLRMSGVGARPDLNNHPKRARTPISSSFPEPLPSGSRTDSFPSTSKYFESDGYIGRNSQFHHLSSAERERLGGVEYRAVVLLEIIVIIYYVLWQLLGALSIGAWIAYNDAGVTLTNGLNPWWVGAFNAVSAFNNSGMSPLDANMVAFQDATFVLITMSFLILAGNTCYPVFLRLILWSLFHLIPDRSHLQEYRVTLRFLLDHPRRCYTTLFPSSHTWWLLASLVILNGTDWIAFEVLNIGNDSITTSPDAPRVLDGLFQAFAVRSGGFYVVPIANLRVGLLVLYVLMMYISVYPVTITIRNSNVYEERSLGIYADDPETRIPPPEKPPAVGPSILSRFRVARKGRSEGTRSYFVRQQLRGQLAHDLWWICLAVLFITIIETQSFGADPVTFAVFNIVFETVSAYGCVGISTGAPNVDYSFSGEWHVLSKLILCAVMLRGRHRGLPVAIDRAVLLPGEHLGMAEEEDAVVRRERTIERKDTEERHRSPAAVV